MELILLGIIALLMGVVGYLLGRDRPKVETKVIDEEAIEREKKLVEHFDALMNYSTEQAYRRAK
jgi:hypothetical protein